MRNLSEPGGLPTFEEALDLAAHASLAELMARAGVMRDEAKGSSVTYSRKVFIPLTRLCRDVCHYCTFAETPSKLPSPYLLPEDVLALAEEGKAAGCKEALFTLGELPEARYAAAREALAALECETTLDYVFKMAQLVLDETGLLPHVNAGAIGLEDYRRLRPVAPSMGLMLESSSPRLCEKGGPHYGSPDKAPEARLASIRDAGRAQVPLTSGILIGIGETRPERIESLFELRALHEEYGHLQEIIIQNFVPKPDTPMAREAAPEAQELQWTIAMARLIFGGQMNIQAPPNLNAGNLGVLIEAGINDWGGVSPVTPDHVNPESPWPRIETLAEVTRRAGHTLVERLTVYPDYISGGEIWIDGNLRPRVNQLCDGEGLAREDAWSPGDAKAQIPLDLMARPPVSSEIAPVSGLQDVLDRATGGQELSSDDIVRLFRARGDDFHAVVEAADRLRAAVCDNGVTYVVNRNINYTNICQYRCTFCAFSKGRGADSLRGQPYLLSFDEIGDRAEEASARGATEVCLQGGIHPDFTGATYLSVCRAIMERVPDIHIHAFSPLEVAHGSQTLGLSIKEFLRRLKAAGLASLPGTAAEILDDDVRSLICPDKITSKQWLEIIETAHDVGLRTTSTIMFGHVDSYGSWARHLIALRDLQKRTGGITELVPLPFVHMESPMYLRGRARPGPTFRETVLMHAVARLALHPHITNIQVSWPKLGPDGAAACLQAGGNDLGGTLMEESISRAAGAGFGQELTVSVMEDIIGSLGRVPRQRTTTYTNTNYYVTDGDKEFDRLASEPPQLFGT